jgi:hypothetical protein
MSGGPVFGSELRCQRQRTASARSSAGPLPQVLRVLPELRGARRRRLRPNPSLERTSTGMALGLRSARCHHPLRRPSAIPAPARSAQTLGRCGHSACSALASAAHGQRRETARSLVHWAHCHRHQSVRGRRARARSTLARLVNTAAVAVSPFSLSHVAAPGSRAIAVQAAISRSTHSNNLGRRGTSSSSRLALLSPSRRPNHHSSGPPPACHLARAAIQVIIRLAGQVPSRWRPLSSNVRPHSPTARQIRARGENHPNDSYHSSRRSSSAL